MNPSVKEMFGRITEDSVRRGWSGVKHGVHRAHARAMHMAGQIDHAVRIAGRAYTALSPMIQAIDSHQGSSIHSGATRAFNEYHNITRLASRAEGYRQRITQDVRRAVPEIDI
jgi:hypothetical protein